ncbi:ferrochelatase [Clostridiaceae bacterium 35-E11]
MKKAGDFKVLFLAMIFGALIISYLVFQGKIERFSIVILTIYGLIFLKNRKNVNARYGSIVIIGTLLGIILCNYSLFFFEYELNIKKEPISIQEPLDTAILLVFNGEPEKYDLPIFIHNLNRKGQIKNKVLAPFALFKYKRIYERVGISRYNDMSKSISSKLSNQLDHGYDVFVSYMYNKPYYKEVINQKIIKGNYGKIIIVPVYTMESKDYVRITNELEMEMLYQKNRMLKFMDPLWDSEKIPQSMAKDIYRSIPVSEKNNIGIILMGQGFGSINKENIEPKVINQERLFMEKIKKCLVENGLEDRRIKFITSYPKDEEIKNALAELQQYGVATIFIVGTNDITDKLQDQYAIQKIIRKFKGIEETNVKYIKGWGNNNSVVQELEFRIRLINVGKWNE